MNHDYGHQFRAALIKQRRGWAARAVDAAGRLCRTLRRRPAIARAGMVMRAVLGNDGLLYLSPYSEKCGQSDFWKQG